MALAALEALVAGVNVRCEVIERDRETGMLAKLYPPQRVDIGRRLVSGGRPEVLEGAFDHKARR